MLRDHLLLVVPLLFGVTLLTILSNKIRVSYPILLVISGLIISVIPGVPNIFLDPDLVFLVFLPPLLYAAAWNTIWKNFWQSRRPIFLLAFGLVIATSATVAYVSNSIIPNFSLAYGFLLGGIISPTDAIAATSVLGNSKIPKRVVTILEGESLLNDASGLVVFRVALAAILGGQFFILKAGQSFLIVATLGIVIGLAIAGVIYLIHRFFPTTPSIDSAITLISPYIMYLTAEHFHFSGVLAVVCGGLFLSYHSQQIFSFETRLQLVGLWETLVYLLNGLVFILIGLQLPHIVNGLEGYSLGQATMYAAIISLVSVVIRIVWVYPGAYLPIYLSKRIRRKERVPPWRNVLLVAWSGMRGVVSLASALAIPLTLSSGEAFPHRNLILYITFVVILVTLVLQGLGLKPLIRLLKIKDDSKDDQKVQGIELRVRLAEAVLNYLDTNYGEEIQKQETFKRVRDRYERMIDIAKRNLDSDQATEATLNFLPKYRKMLVELVHLRRRELNLMSHNGEFSEELIRERLLELDLEEARLKH
ncbi:MAG: Na+/H+ antiporter [Bacteroidetes bacterium]|nr:MAG: Na+/H+ antiporter [Bacteroidota bacterium]